MMKRRSAFRATHACGAFSLVEGIISLMVISVMLVAALNTLGAAQGGLRKTGERGKGAMFAQRLMAEVLQQAYAEPGTSGTFGREAGEGSSSRTTWDDVDDYDGFSESTLRDKAGSALADAAGWKWEVSVAWVKRTTLPGLPAAPGTDTGIKRITVTVSSGGVTAARLISCRTAGWPNAGE